MPHAPARSILEPTVLLPFRGGKVTEPKRKLHFRGKQHREGYLLFILKNLKVQSWRGLPVFGRMRKMESEVRQTVLHSLVRHRCVSIQSLYPSMFAYLQKIADTNHSTKLSQEKAWSGEESMTVHHKGCRRPQRESPQILHTYFSCQISAIIMMFEDKNINQ